MADRPFDARAFRAELVKIMPGYVWTVHRPTSDLKLCATGTRSSGFNRLSTLQITRTVKGNQIYYDAKSSGPGTHAPWLGAVVDTTLARALRVLQQFYRAEAARYGRHYADMEQGRDPTGSDHA